MELVNKWSDMSFGGEGEKRMISGTPMGHLRSSVMNDSVTVPTLTAFFGLRTVQLAGTEETSDMALVKFLDDPFWIHIGRASVAMA